MRVTPSLTYEKKYKYVNQEITFAMAMKSDTNTKIQLPATRIMHTFDTFWPPRWKKVLMFVIFGSSFTRDLCIVVLQHGNGLYQPRRRNTGLWWQWLWTEREEKRRHRWPTQGSLLEDEPLDILSAKFGDHSSLQTSWRDCLVLWRVKIYHLNPPLFQQSRIVQHWRRNRQEIQSDCKLENQSLVQQHCNRQRWVQSWNKHDVQLYPRKGFTEEKFVSYFLTSHTK